ncbi:MAG: hypothetical protein P1S60_07350 [Anaerolineae bacterium]|nr:hypothetical protein [Anaerolineae bacterium]
MASGYMDYAGYRDCVVLQNSETRVILGPHMGGRVLEYAYHGVNTLMLDPNQNGWTYSGEERPRMGPSGGRFDVGPENTMAPHPNLWFGPWTAEITGEYSAKMTSQPDSDSGMQLEREFSLSPGSTRLDCRQIVHNIADQTLRCCHWSRTFGLGHGICVVPLSSYSKFPAKYIMYGPGPVMNYRPDDPHIRVDDEFLVMFDTPEHPKLGIDAHEGWFAYLMPNNLMLVKQFPTFPNRVYNEMAGITISLWYLKDFVCELEPIGPMEVLTRGEQADFTETWYVVNFPFPEQRDQVDARQVASLAQQLMR